jgi:spore maturation protein CgeB
LNAYSYVFLGLSITSSWGNGHATTYRGLLKQLKRRGHRVLFLERELPFYERHRDLRSPPDAPTELYGSLAELERRFTPHVRDADLVVVGSYVPEGAEVGAFVQDTARGKTAFYDIDTPVTLRKLDQGDNGYLSPALIPRYDLYLSFTGGPMIEHLQRTRGARRVRPLYCSVDPEHYYPEPSAPRWDLGYLGTYSEDRHPSLARLLIEPARRFREGRFVVAGAQYPSEIQWPGNVERREHVPPDEHRAFYNAQRFTLNVTRAEMCAAGYSPSVRLFEAAACGVPVVSDAWPGLDEFFELGREILIAGSPEEALCLIREMKEPSRIDVGRRARARVLRHHTAAHRAEELERYTRELHEERRTQARPGQGASDTDNQR